MKKHAVCLMGLIMVFFLLVQGACIASRASGANVGTAANTSNAAAAGSQVASSQQMGIAVSGEGRVTAAPDIAILRLGVESKANTAEEARNKAATAMSAVVSALKANGVAEKDIKTSRFTISPVVRYQNQVEIREGFRVSNIVTAQVRKVDDADKVIDAVIKAGGDLIRIEQINFGIDDPTPYQKEAREKAMSDAKSKAEQLARLGGVTLGKPAFISEGGGIIPVPVSLSALAMPEGKGGAVEPTPISPGEINIQLSVQVVYSIQ